MLAIFEHFREAKVLSIIQAFFWYFSRKKFFFREYKNKSNLARKNIFQRKRRQTRNLKDEDWEKISGVKLKIVMNFMHA